MDNSTANASVPGVLVAINIHRACHIVTFVIAIVLLVLDVRSIIKAKRMFSLRSPGSRLRYWQALITLGILGHSICFLTALFGDYRGNTEPCWYLMGLVPLIFLSVKTCVEFFLYDRAKVVHEALKLRWKSIIMLRWILWFAIAGLLPLFAVPVILFFHGDVLPEGMCIQICTRYQIPLAFVIGDFGLGTAMVTLFTVPLISHTRKMQTVGLGNHVSTDLRRIIKSNLIFSSLIIVSGFASLVVYSAFFLVYQNETYFHAYADITPNIDMCIIVVLVHAMDTHWLPEPIRSRLCKHAAEDEESKLSGPTTTSGKNKQANSRNEPTSTGEAPTFWSRWRQSRTVKKVLAAEMSDQGAAVVAAAGQEPDLSYSGMADAPASPKTTISKSAS